MMPTEPTERRIEFPPLSTTREDYEVLNSNTGPSHIAIVIRERQLRESIAEIQALRESRERIDSLITDLRICLENRGKELKAIREKLEKSESDAERFLTQAHTAEGNAVYWQRKYEAIMERMERPLPPRTSAQSWAWLGSEKVIRASEIDLWIEEVKG